MARGANDGFWHWPGLASLAYAYLVIGAPMFVAFASIYAGADYLTGLHDFRTPLYLSFELAIPFVPATAVLYNSLHLAYAMAPFVLRTRRQTHSLAIVWLLMTLVAGIVFLAFPFEHGFPRPSPAELGVWADLYRLADQANLRFNSCPSLHVAWGVCCVDVYSRFAGRRGRWLLAAWGCGMTASTVLLHQHHLIDVAGGLALAFWGSRWLFPRLCDRRADDQADD